MKSQKNRFNLVKERDYDMKRLSKIHSISIFFVALGIFFIFWGQNCTYAEYVSENFESGPGGFSDGENFSVSDGRYLFEGDGTDNFQIRVWAGGSYPGGWKPQPDNSNYFQDFFVSADISRESGPDDVGYGLVVCTYQNTVGSANYIRLLIGGAGYYKIDKRVGDAFEDIDIAGWTGSDLINKGIGSKNRLSVMKAGDEFTFYINNTKIFRQTIYGFGGGAIGLYVNNLLSVSFDNFRIASVAEKAIIVAGSGPGDWNNLWDATQICANYAYGALLYQGFTKENIYYLTHDANSDDRDAPATNAEFQKAITDWAKDADNVFIYMVGHGGEGTFRMGASELLQASELDTWLDTLQGVIPGNVIFVYDACRSGSFLSVLKPPPGKQRILIASASSSQEAIFATQGKVSFSFIFWASQFNGNSFYDCFTDAKKTVSLVYQQAPQLDANGNGISNEEEDQEIARSVTFGNETKSSGDLPLIGSVSPAQTLNGETSALIYAENVIDADGIGRVWAVIMPPGYSSGSPDIPVTTLPTVDLQSVGNNRYEGTYTGFDTAGVYNIAVFAIDQNVVIGDPVQTSVTQTQGVKLKGDINDDKIVNLADALIAFKVAVNYDDEPLPIRADYVSSGIDVNGDNKIGIAEAIYILRYSAGLE